MSYYAYDKNGYIGDAASNSGWFRFAQEAEGLGNELRALASQGVSENIPVLRQELGKVRMKDPSSESIRQNLVRLAGIAEGVLGISDGVG